MGDEPTLPGEPSSLAAAPATLPHLAQYRILRRLGEGGMGEVYLAEQCEPVQRQVALKLIKPGMDTRRVIARFESERQALALMSHASIARVHDAGVTPNGRPYFVMEYVDGLPIDEFCARQGLGIDERLALFIEVCAGVHHAHQKGVIHRDLKASNILVRSEDGRPLPKIIDFGVAKATSARGPDEIAFTLDGQPVGTPGSMSPEQLRGSADVDVRSDVYALGVLLYELLTGTLPFEVSHLALDELRRAVLEVEPLPPSARVRQRHAARAPRIDRDLDWITLKALEKEPARRYASVSELAADVARHRSHHPVLAGAPSRRYRLAKFVARHRTAVAAGALVAAALVAGTLAATLGMLRAREAEALARDAAARATLESRTARQISSFLVSLFAINDPSEARGNAVTAREILDRGAAEIHAGLAGERLVRARLMDVIGRVYQSLGLYEPARGLLGEALELRRTSGAPPTELAESLDSMGQLHHVTGEHALARRLAEEALERRVDALGPEHEDVALSLHNLATVLWRAGERDAARALYERAIAIRERGGPAGAAGLAESMKGLALVLAAAGDADGARRLGARVLALQEQALGPDHPQVAQTAASLAKLLADEDDLAAARPLYERALAIQERTLGADHPQVAYALSGLADVLVRLDEHDAARPLLERAVAIAERGLGPLAVAETSWQLAGLHRAQGSTARADALYRRSLVLRRHALGAGDPRVLYDEACYAALAGRRDEAIAGLRRALAAGWSESWIADDPDLAALHDLPAFREIVATVVALERPDP